MPFNSFDDYPMSWLPSLDRNTHSLYQALARQLEDDIAAGVIRPGTKLPPQRELADFLDINVSTVSKAFKLCELKGLLSARVGSGTFVAYDALTSGRLLTEHEQGRVIDMGATVPEPSGNSFLMEMLQEIASSEENARLFSYQGEQSMEWHRETSAWLLNSCGCSAEYEQILFASGGQNALSAILAAMFRRGDKIAVDDHTYPGIKSAASMMGIQLIPVQQDSEGMNPDALDFVCRNEKISGVYIIPACHNPTTISMPQRRRREIAQVIRDYHCLLIEDGTYQLMDGKQCAISEEIKEQSIYLVSLSKVIAPGLRMACLKVPLRLKSEISDALYSLNISIAPLMAELTARVIASGQFEKIILNHKQNTSRRNEVVDQYLSPEICLGKETDIFRWLLLPEKYTGAAFETLALSKGVQVFAAEKFAVGKTPPAHAVRLSICAPESLARLEEGMKIITQLLNE